MVKFRVKVRVMVSEFSVRVTVCIKVELGL